MIGASTPDSPRVLTVSALGALVLAAYTHGCAVTAYGDKSPEARDALDNQRTLSDDALETLGIISRESEAYRASLGMPVTLEAAAHRLLGIEKMYHIAQADFLDKLDVWQLADSQGARIRVGVVERLQQPAPEGKGLSYSAADKAASAEPEYTQHKDRCAELAAAKQDAEAERDAALHSMLNAREILHAMSTETFHYQSRAGS
jgi:hypothetical protein